MRNINLLVLHCSATPPSMDIGVDKIREWHVEGNKWSDVGYHWIIRRDGTLEQGRSESKSGAHARGFNSQSIGVCLIGGVDSKMNAESNFTKAQYQALFSLHDDLIARYPDAKWKGHNELSTKACPSLNVKELF